MQQTDFNNACKQCQSSPNNSWFILDIDQLRACPDGTSPPDLTSLVFLYQTLLNTGIASHQLYLS